MIHFKTKEDIDQFKSLLETSFKTVWNKIAKPDIDRYIDSKTEMMAKNSQRIFMIEKWLCMIYIGRVGISITLLVIAGGLITVMLIL